MKTWIGFISIFLCLCFGFHTTAGADEKTSNLSIAITQLGDPSPAVREHATRQLWLSGAKADPLLDRAVKSSNPEVSSRARLILRNIRSGILPDTSPEIVELANLYRTGNANQKEGAANRLARSGPPGLHVLLALLKQEKDTALRQLLLEAMAPRAREAAAPLIASGDLEGADTLLRDAAPIGQSAARDNAAFALLRGTAVKQEEKLKADLQTPNPQWASARPLIYLARANGDWITAHWAAASTAEPGLLDSVLIEQGSWKELADRFRSRPGDTDSFDTLTFCAAFSRLAGDKAGLDNALSAIETYGANHDEDLLKCSDALFLNDAPERGIKLLIDHRKYARAVEFLMPRMEYQQVVNLAAKARAEHHPDRWELRLREAVALHYMGQRDAAKAILAEVTADPRALLAEQWAMVVEADRQIGEPAQAEHHRLTGLSIVPPDSAESLVEGADFPEDFPALSWWLFVRKHNASESVEKSWKTLQSLAEGKLPLEKLTNLADTAVEDLKSLREHHMPGDENISTAAEALYSAHHIPEALHYFQKLNELDPSPHVLRRIGDCQAVSGDWNAAIDTYRQLWDHDQTQAVPLALLAWALERAGNHADSAKLLATSHLLPLADDAMRMELVDTFEKHDMHADAQKEMDIVIKTAPFLSRSIGRVDARQADEAARKKDYLKTAEILDRAFLGNFQSNLSFSRPWANLAIPALIHRSRAMGFAVNGHPDEALQQGKICLSETPNDADGLIDVVNTLSEHGAKGQSQALFDSALAVYQKSVNDFSQSGPARNLLAWFEVRCNRNLDDALRNAQRAVELEPDNTASLDTLAEIRFARGDVDGAIKAMQRCIELEPDLEHNQQQMKRFTAAKSKAPASH